MATPIQARRAGTLSGLVGLVALLLLFAAPQAAQAAESHFCYGQSVSAKNYCHGAARTYNATYGQGASGSVCIGNGVSGSACSGGAGEGVYKAVGEWIYNEPWITNNMWSGSQTVYGIAFTP